MADPPSPAATRSLVMIAKCLQNLANLVEFGSKEPFMEVKMKLSLKLPFKMVKNSFRKLFHFIGCLCSILICLCIIRTYV